MKVKVAVLQYNVPESSEDAFKKFEGMVNKASWMGAKLVVAPETAIGNSSEVKESGVDYLPQLQEIAKKYKVFLSTSYYSKKKGKFYNQGYIVSPQAKVVVSHKKIYPAKPEVDEIGVLPGKKLEVAKTPIGKLGMLICKDGFNRHSHFLYEKFNKLGVEIICIPSWSLGWRQMDTHEYVSALYTYGAFASRAFILLSGNTNPATSSYGRSMIISPINGVIAQTSETKKEILVEELDLGEIERARKFDSWWQPKTRIKVK